MNRLLCLDASDYGERVLLYRVFVQDVKAEALVLLCELMNDYPLTKKDISDYAAGKITFSSYVYNEGYVFEGRLTQAQSKSLTYLFSNPYLAGEEIFADILSHGFMAEERKLAFCKEKVLYEKSLEENSSYQKTLSLLSVPYSPLPINPNLLREIRISDCQNALQKILASTKGDILMLGNSKTNVIKALTLKENPLPELVRIQGKEPGNLVLEDESLTYLFSHDCITSTVSKASLLASFITLIAFLEKKLKNLVSVDYQIHTGILDQRTSYLTFTVGKGKSDSLKQWVPLSLKEKMIPAAFADVSSGLGEAKMEEIRLHMDSSLMIHEWLLDRDFGFSCQPVNLTEENVLSMASTLTLEEILRVK